MQCIVLTTRTEESEALGPKCHVPCTQAVTSTSSFFRVLLTLTCHSGSVQKEKSSLMTALYDSKKPCSSCLEKGQRNGHKLGGAAGTADAVLITNMTKED